MPDWGDWQIESVGAAPAPDLVEHARRHVAHSGWTVIGLHVWRYIYTVGLTRVGLPELVMRFRRGDPLQAQEILCDLVSQAAQQKRVFAAGQEWAVECGTVMLVAIADDVAARICPVAAALYGGRGPIQAVEVVLS